MNFVNKFKNIKDLLVLDCELVINKNIFFFSYIPQSTLDYINLLSCKYDFIFFNLSFIKRKNLFDKYNLVCYDFNDVKKLYEWKKENNYILYSNRPIYIELYNANTNSFQFESITYVINKLENIFN